MKGVNWIKNSKLKKTRLNQTRIIKPKISKKYFNQIRSFFSVEDEIWRRFFRCFCNFTNDNIQYSKVWRGNATRNTKNTILPVSGLNSMFFPVIKKGSLNSSSLYFKIDILKRNYYERISLAITKTAKTNTAR